MEYTEQDYLDFDLFQGEEGELSLRTVKMVVARKTHKCFFGLGAYADGHEIPKGGYHRYEKALVDGDFWGEYRVCTDCMDKYLSELDGDNE